jgi:hypothetical protein
MSFGALVRCPVCDRDIAVNSAGAPVPHFFGRYDCGSGPRSGVVLTPQRKVEKARRSAIAAPEAV